MVLSSGSGGRGDDAPSQEPPRRRIHPGRCGRCSYFFRCLARGAADRSARARDPPGDRRRGAEDDTQPIDRSSIAIARKRSSRSILTAYLKRRLTRLRCARRSRCTTSTGRLESVGEERRRAAARINYRRSGASNRISADSRACGQRFPRSRPSPTIRAAARCSVTSCSARSRLSTAATSSRRPQGSWAGALGQPQFMPSTYLKFPQDLDGDGRRDIWTSLGDVFASVAFYLQRARMVGDSTWGREVKVPKAARAAIVRVPRRETGCRAERALTKPISLEGWRRLGVKTTANRPCRGTGRARQGAPRAGQRSVARHRWRALLPRLPQLRGAPHLQLRDQLRDQHRHAVGSSEVARWLGLLGRSGTQ